MIDVCLLGTGGMMPLPYRWLTSLYVRYNGKVLLVDCGEGTQIAMKAQGLSAKPIDAICFTHFHGDHISGLPGLLLSMANSSRTQPVHLYGPKGLQHVAESLCVVARDLPFEVVYHEYIRREETFSFAEITVEAFHVRHNIPCYGYSMQLPRRGRFDAEAARAAEIPLKFWNRLQKGETLEENGRIFTPDMVLGPPRKGLRLTYVTDSRPTQSIAAHAAGSDLFICEGMYADKDKQEQAKQKKHMTMQEAAAIAREACVGQLWFTHYSPSLNYPENYMGEIRKIFPAAVAAKDGQSCSLLFEDETE